MGRLVAVQAVRERGRPQVAAHDAGAARRKPPGDRPSVAAGRPR
jgi:hypothetical protein